MSRNSTRLLKAGLSALHYSGVGSLLAPLTRGRGVVFMMHRVSPDPVADFEPNRILRITPDFLERVVRQILARGFECISLDDLPGRVADPAPRPPFACFTFDDGYRDNRDHAFPILRRYGVPHTLYVPTDYPDGRGDLWWLVLEAAIREAGVLDVAIGGETERHATGTVAEKERAFDAIYWRLRSLPEHTARAIVARLARDAGVDDAALCRELIMTWDEIRAAARDPLLTIGAHTCAHYALSKLDAAEVRREMADSRRRIEAETGRDCRHFSYPYGCERSAGPREFAIAREVGFETAVTTRKGLVHRGHADALTAIPRLSLNGDFQSERYIDVMLSGLPFAMWNTARSLLSPASA